MYDNLPNYIQLTISNYFNVACGTCAPGYFNVNNFQVSDDYTWIHGRHQFAFGIDARKEQFNSTNNQQANGQITFNGNTTGDALADLMIGRMSSFVDGNALSDYMRQTVFAAYAQDNLRLTDAPDPQPGCPLGAVAAGDRQIRPRQPVLVSRFHRRGPQRQVSDRSGGIAVRYRPAEHPWQDVHGLALAGHLPARRHGVGSVGQRAADHPRGVRVDS